MGSRDGPTSARRSADAGAEAACDSAAGCGFTIGRAVCCVFATAALAGADTPVRDGSTEEMALASLGSAVPNQVFGFGFRFSGFDVRFPVETFGGAFAAACGSAIGRIGGGIGAEVSGLGFGTDNGAGCGLTIGRAVCCVFATAALDGADTPAHDGSAPEMALVSLGSAVPNHVFGCGFSFSGFEARFPAETFGGAFAAACGSAIGRTVCTGGGGEGTATSDGVLSGRGCDGAAGFGGGIGAEVSGLGFGADDATTGGFVGAFAAVGAFTIGCAGCGGFATAALAGADTPARDGSTAAMALVSFGSTTPDQVFGCGLRFSGFDTSFAAEERMALSGARPRRTAKQAAASMTGTTASP